MSLSLRSVLIICVLLHATPIAIGQAADAEPTEEPPATSSLLAPEPRSDEFDWMRFHNGEWLKGEIQDLQYDSFKFESDELGTFNLDFDDIETLYSPNLNTIMLKDRRVFEGSIAIDNKEITVTTADGETHTFARDEIRAIIPGRLNERNYWSGKLGFGSTVRRGNTNQTDVTASLFVQRRDLNSRFNIDYMGTFSAFDGETTTDNHRGTTFYDWYFSPRFFWRTAAITAYRDQFQNIDYRITPSTGVGYDLIDKDGFEWYVGGGVGWEYTKFFEPLPGAPPDQSLAAILFGTNITWEATSKIDVGFEFNISVPPKKANNYNFHTAFKTEVELWGDFDLDVSIIWDRVNNPAPSFGVTPEKDDLRMFVGIGWEF